MTPMLPKRRTASSLTLAAVIATGACSDSPTKPNDVPMPPAAEITKFDIGIDDADARLVPGLADQKSAVTLEQALSDLETHLNAGNRSLSLGDLDIARAALGAYGRGTDARRLDAPELGAIEVVLDHAALLLGVDLGADVQVRKSGTGVVTRSDAEVAK
jgi:hypothetical protein